MAGRFDVNLYAVDFGIAHLAVHDAVVRTLLRAGRLHAVLFHRFARRMAGRFSKVADYVFAAALADICRIAALRTGRLSHDAAVSADIMNGKTLAYTDEGDNLGAGFGLNRAQFLIVLEKADRKNRVNGANFFCNEGDLRNCACGRGNIGIVIRIKSEVRVSVGANAMGQFIGFGQ